MFETTGNARNEHNLITASSPCEWKYETFTASEDEITEANDLIEHRIRERAFQLWQEAGSPEGQADEFWYRARAIETESDADQSPDIVEEAGGHYPPTGDTQNFA